MDKQIWSKIRLSFVLMDSDSQKKNQILNRLIANVLASEGKSEGTSYSQISESLKNAFDLSFSRDEIESAIKTDDKGRFVIVAKPNGTVAVALKKNSSESQLKSEPVNYFKKIISRFLSAGAVDKEILSHEKEEEIEEYLFKYLYSVFNSTAKEISQLLSSKYSDIKPYRISLTPNQQEIVVAFLKWNDEEKDRSVFSVIKAAYEYCFLSSGDSEKEIKDLFSGKNFYLDTNVIFSLAGINGADEQIATRHFIEKCREEKISLRYTNETSSECTNTLYGFAKSIEESIDFNKKPFFSEKAIQEIFPNSKTSIFFSKYLEWTRSTGYDLPYSFSGFLEYFSSDTQTVLNSLKQTMIPDQLLLSNKSVTNELVKDLGLAKIKSNRKPSEQSLKCDVINYCYIKSNYSSSGNVFKNQQFFMISLDKVFCDWARQKMNGCIPVFVSPDVMYSIMLRTSGRSANDMRSFNEFLSMSFSFEEDKEIDAAKKEMFKAVSLIKESNDEAKEQILLRANTILVSEYDKRDKSLSVKDVVKEAEESFYNTIIDESEKDKKETISAKDTEIKELERKAKEKDEKYIDHITDKKLSHRKGIIITARIFFGLIVGILIGLGIWFGVTKGFATMDPILTFVGVVIAFFPFVFSFVPKMINKFVDREAIRERVAKDFYDKHF